MTRALFYIAWVAMQIMQAYFTELSADEAYYWAYSQELAWGYFDHPPGIAVLINLGYKIFQNELGVRILLILCNTITVYLWEKIIVPANPKVFYTLVSATAIIHFLGFMALPDSPLLLAYSLYIFLFKKYIEGPSVKYALALGVVAGAMILSKYHGVLVLLFTILPNPKLALKKEFWIAVVTSTLLLLPHLFWQIQHGFPTLSYHFFERSNKPYTLLYTLEYVFSAVLTLGPFNGLLFFAAVYIIKANNDFERSLRYMFWGIYIFFLFMSFKGKVEAHWTLLAIFPGLYFAYKLISAQVLYHRLFYRLSLVALVLIFAARVTILSKPNMVLPKLVQSVRSEFQNKRNMMLIKAQAQTMPVAFMNSYQRAALYSFYTNSVSFSLNNVMGRKNQYDIWDYENRLRGQSVFLIPNYEVNSLPTIKGLEKFHFQPVHNFQSYSCIKIKPCNLLSQAHVGEKIQTKLVFTKPNSIKVDFDANADFPSYLSYQFFKQNKLIKNVVAFKLSNTLLDSICSLEIEPPLAHGKYDLAFSIQTGWLPQTTNSKKYAIKVVPTQEH